MKETSAKQWYSHWGPFYAIDAVVQLKRSKPVSRSMQVLQLGLSYTSNRRQGMELGSAIAIPLYTCMMSHRGIGCQCDCWPCACEDTQADTAVVKGYGCQSIMLVMQLSPYPAYDKLVIECNSSTSASKTPEHDMSCSCSSCCYQAQPQSTCCIGALHQGLSFLITCPCALTAIRLCVEQQTAPGGAAGLVLAVVTEPACT
jgi:hypothetical protein